MRLAGVPPAGAYDHGAIAFERIEREIYIDAPNAGETEILYVVAGEGVMTVDGIELTDEQIATVIAWVDGGAPQGNPIRSVRFRFRRRSDHPITP